MWTPGQISGVYISSFFEGPHRFDDGLRFLWPLAWLATALSLEGQLPFALVWSCLFNLTQWRKAWHWPESAALMCSMFCIHHCHRAEEDHRHQGREGKGLCVYVRVCVCGRTDSIEIRQEIVFVKNNFLPHNYESTKDKVETIYV